MDRRNQARAGRIQLIRSEHHQPGPARKGKRLLGKTGSCEEGSNMAKYAPLMPHNLNRGNHQRLFRGELNP